MYRNIAGTWTKLGADINGEAASDVSGSSVAISSDGTIVAIGAKWNDGGGVGVKSEVLLGGFAGVGCRIGVGKGIVGKSSVGKGAGHC